MVEGRHVIRKKQVNILHKQITLIKTTKMLFGEQILTLVFRSYAK